MASNAYFNVSPSFDLGIFAGRLIDTYRARGYFVNGAYVNGCYVISFEKGTGGINTVLGLGTSIKASCSVVNGALSISFYDEEWTSKIIGFVIGWILCLIPLITAIIGTVDQMQLPKSITNDAMMIAAGM